MSELRSSLRAYLALRRALGFKLERAGRLLEDFVTFAERAGAEVVTVDVALAWATLPERTHPVWPVQRLGAVRGFARYLHALDARTEVPSADLLCGRYQRVAPYLYSEADVAALMAAARSLRPPLWAATVETFIGLLGAAGLRAGEAMRLDRDDLDPCGPSPCRHGITRAWRGRRRASGRGAVALVGPTRSRKTTAAIAGILDWDGPAILCSVKSDLQAATRERRSARSSARRWPWASCPADRRRGKPGGLGSGDQLAVARNHDEILGSKRQRRGEMRGVVGAQRV